MTKPVWEPTEFTKQMRTAIADYMYTEGCSCCRSDEHGDNKAKIAKLLRIRKIGGYYNFSKYRTPSGKKEG